MKKFLCLAMVLSMLAPPGLWAEPTPEIPASKADVKALPADVSATADTSQDVEIPKEEPVVDKPESIKLTPEKPGRFRWGNLFLGALGGGILAASAGFLLFTGSKKDGSIDYDSARVVVPVSALIGIVAGGGLSVLLGLTTPLPVAPPSMNSDAARDGLAWEPCASGQRLVLTTRF